MTLLEAFEWYSPEDGGQHWRRLKHALSGLKSIGIDSLWIPPACKAGSTASTGYDVYDLYVLFSIGLLIRAIKLKCEILQI